MVKIKFSENLIVPEPSDINDHVECHIWLDIESAKDVARKLINQDSIFTYMPVPDIVTTDVEIIAFDDDLDKVLELEVRVKQ